MKIKSNGTNPTANYKSFNVLLEETPAGLRVAGAFGAQSLNTPEDKWTRLNARNFARSLNGSKLVIK